jgi:hypothetical protein
MDAEEQFNAKVGQLCLVYRMVMSFKKSLVKLIYPGVHCVITLAVIRAVSESQA